MNSDGGACIAICDGIPAGAEGHVRHVGKVRIAHIPNIARGIADRLRIRGVRLNRRNNEKVANRTWSPSEGDRCRAAIEGTLRRTDPSKCHIRCPISLVLPFQCYAQIRSQPTATEAACRYCPLARGCCGTWDVPGVVCCPNDPAAFAGSRLPIFRSVSVAAAVSPPRNKSATLAS